MHKYIHTDSNFCDIEGQILIVQLLEEIAHILKLNYSEDKYHNETVTFFGNYNLLYKLLHFKMYYLITRMVEKVVISTISICAHLAR